MNELRTVATTKNDTLPLRCPEGQQVVVGAAADPLFLVLADAAEAAQDLLREKRTKWYAIKYHWFRTQLEPNGVELKKIDTKIQKGDLFTKPFKRDRFEELRKLVLGSHHVMRRKRSAPGRRLAATQGIS